MTGVRRSARIEALKSKKGKCRIQELSSRDRYAIPSLEEFLSIRKSKLASVQERPVIRLLKKLKRDVQQNPSLWVFYRSLMRWLITIQTSTEIEVGVLEEEVPFIPGFLRFIKAIDSSIVPKVVKGPENMHVIAFTVDGSSSSLDDCVLDGDHLFPQWPICRPGFDILQAEWC